MRDAERKPGHARRAARSTQGVSLSFPGFGHDHQPDRPDAVVSAIETGVYRVTPGRPAG